MSARWRLRFPGDAAALRKTFEGGGFYVLSEYSIEGQGFRFGDEADGVVLHPVDLPVLRELGRRPRREVPPKFDEINKFCGVRLMFQSETREQLRKQPGRARDQLRPHAGEAARQVRQARQILRRGQVVIETLEGESSDPGRSQVQHLALVPGARPRPAHRPARRAWCCRSTRRPAVGTVLYSTPLLWEFAYARENNGFKGDRLFKMLHARN